jgi:hypothetical protein
MDDRLARSGQLEPLLLDIGQSIHLQFEVIYGLSVTALRQASLSVSTDIRGTLYARRDP